MNTRDKSAACLRPGHSRTRRMPLLTLLLATLLPLMAFAQAGGDAQPLRFQDDAEATRFHHLTAELRCVKCQNQSLADSNAAIAQDLRHEVLALMRQDKTDDEVKHYLVARYGEFVLYRPQVGPSTWLLWFGPALLLVVGMWVIGFIVRRRTGVAGQARQPVPTPDEDAQEW